jgi:hypothetical protein
MKQGAVAKAELSGSVRQTTIAGQSLSFVIVLILLIILIIVIIIVVIRSSSNKRKLRECESRVAAQSGP